MNRKKIIILGLGLGLLLVVLIIFNRQNLFESYIDFTEGLATFTVSGDSATMRGVIGKSTIDRVELLLENHPNIKTIVMEDVPGSINDEANLKASRLIRNAKVNTHVPEDGYIASGGVDFFCAGIKRTAHPNSTIGVHSWANGEVNNAILLPRDHPDHKKYIEYYKDMGIDINFYWFTLESADASNMYDMTQEERELYLLNNISY